MSESDRPALRKRQIDLLVRYLDCFASNEATGDDEFDAAYALEDQAEIILKRLEAA